MDTEGTTLETGEQPPMSDDLVLKLVHLNPRLGCVRISKRYPCPQSRSIPNQSLTALMQFHSLTCWFAIPWIGETFLPALPFLPRPPSIATAPTTASVNLRKSYLDLYNAYFTYVTHGTQLCAAKHNEEKKSISRLLISLICLIGLWRVQFKNVLGVS